MTSKIDVCLGTIGRTSQFQRTIQSLNNQNNVGDINLFVLDGNNDNSVLSFIKSNRFKFSSVHIFKENECIPNSGRGRWPIMYNFLFKKGNAPLTTFWSDDVFPEPDCFGQGVKHFHDPNVGAVAFAWCDGDGSKHTIYGTEIHKQVMLNFGLIRRSALHRAKYIDENYLFYHADQDLSLKIWYLKYKVIRALECKCTHFSGIKSQNVHRSKNAGEKDSRRLSSKWAYEKVRKRTVEL